MHPVSKERVEWCRARIELLTQMINELRDKPRKFIRPGIDNTFISPTLESMNCERLQLVVELEVLTEFYANQGAVASS